MRRTQIAFIGMRLLGTPLWCLLNMLAFILYKNGSVSGFQIALLLALKPASSLLSPYWSQRIYGRPDKLISNLKGADLLRYLPFLFFPWVHSSWFIIASFGFFMMLTRATVPAWMELFKYNLPKSKPETMVGAASVIDFLGTAILTLGLGLFLDRFPESWPRLFSMTALVGLAASAFLYIIERPTPSPAPIQKTSLLNPWQEVGKTVLSNKDFLIFQIGFMLGGSGLMIMQPALPQFFIDSLDLSFVEMGLAIALCKGVGVALTFPFWTRLFRKINLFRMSALVTFFAALFPFFLQAASLHLSLLYIAYIFYGIMQAGSEMSWHMSGLVFAKDRDSSPFSTTNVLTVGLRGLIVPFLGSFFLPFCHTFGLILMGAFFCLSASIYFLIKAKSLELKALKDNNS